MMTDTPADLAARCDELEAVVGKMTPGERAIDPIYVCCCGMPLNGSHDHNTCGPPEHANDCGCDECEQRWGDPDDARCHYCGGDGDVWGSELGDPLWYDVNELYSCPCCNGSGNAKDCTFW